jgi:hypothetical protein
MTTTYDCIATETTSATTSSITFSSIPSTYTDLVLVINNAAVNTVSYVGMRFNGDTANNYGSTRLYGVGGTTYSDASGNRGEMLVGTATASGSQLTVCHIFNYTNTTTFKTVLSRDNTTSLRVGLLACSWFKSTPEAINSITLLVPDSSGWTADSTFALYGIKAE